METSKKKRPSKRIRGEKRRGVVRCCPGTESCASRKREVAKREKTEESLTEESKRPYHRKVPTKKGMARRNPYNQVIKEKDRAVIPG